MLTPSSVTAAVMSRQGVQRALVLGSPGVGHALREAGIATCTAADADHREVQAVYVGWHPDCNMKDIEAACNAIWNGAKLYTASDVPFFATKQGRSMGYSYAIIGAIKRMTRVPVILTGKPSLHALRFVGDDPLVEMQMARRGGAVGMGVTTGVTNAAMWAAQPAKQRPDWVLQSLAELQQVLNERTA